MSIFDENGKYVRHSKRYPSRRIEIVNTYCKDSTDKVRRIFQRFLEEIPQFGEIELKTFDKYPSYYFGRRLVGVECQKYRVKLHLNAEDAKYADKFEELRGSMYLQRGREEWAFIDIVNEKQVEPALEVIRSAYHKRRPSGTSIGSHKKNISEKKTLEEIKLGKGNEPLADLEKLRRLKILEKKVWDCNKCDFNERTDARFCGGKGKDFRVMFIAKVPSTSGGTGKFLGEQNFNTTEADELFSKVRSNFGLESCYSTDFVKCGIPNGSPTKHKVDQCVEYVREELEIVKPKVIVAVGKTFNLQGCGKPYDFVKLLKDYLNVQIPIVSTWHYYYVNRYLKSKQDKMKEYEEQHLKILSYL